MQLVINIRAARDSPLKLRVGELQEKREMTLNKQETPDKQALTLEFKVALR